jgi:hypothetical protein
VSAREGEHEKIVGVRVRFGQAFRPRLEVPVRGSVVGLACGGADDRCGFRVRGSCQRRWSTRRGRQNSSVPDDIDVEGPPVPCPAWPRVEPLRRPSLSPAVCRSMTARAPK